MPYTEKIVISVGGSLIVPQGGIDTTFLTNLNNFIRDQILANKQRQFFLVAGGGATTRHYQSAAKTVIGGDIVAEDVDWLGIHVTRLNGQLLRTIFRDIAHPVVLENFETIRKIPEPVVIAAGWRPGHSTDTDAVIICEDYNVKSIINLSDIDRVHDSDPNKNKDAKPIDKISWGDFRKLVGDKWIPGMNSPFDPIASKRAQELGIKVAVLNGHNFENLKNYLDGKEFLGTVIE